MKLNKKHLAILIVLVILLLGMISLAVYVFVIRQNNKFEVVLNDNLKAEIYEEVNLFSFIQEVKHGVVVTEDTNVDTSVLGEKKLSIKIKTEKEKIEDYSFSIQVVDTTGPVIEAEDELRVFVGTDIDLLKNVTVTDNSLETIEAVVQGEYNVNQLGDYSLSYVAKDSSNNETVKNFVLHIIDRPNYGEEVPSDYTFTTSKGFKGEVKNGVTYIDGVLVVNKTYSVPSTYGNGLTKETQDAFNEMNSDALPLGLNLYISSGYRSYNTQVSTYNYFVGRDGKEAADTYSARAGHSEHQTGLAFDLNSISDAFTDTPEGKWVHENAWRYGLILRYPYGKDDITGYKHESWHLRYVGKELAAKLYNDGDWITLEEYFGIDSKYE